MTRFGIVAEFHPEEALDYANHPFLKMVSSDFIIQPMIFKDIHCEGEVSITKHWITKNQREANKKGIGSCVYREEPISLKNLLTTPS